MMLPISVRYAREDVSLATSLPATAPLASHSMAMTISKLWDQMLVLRHAPMALTANHLITVVLHARISHMKVPVCLLAPMIPTSISLLVKLCAKTAPVLKIPANKGMYLT